MTDGKDTPCLAVCTTLYTDTCLGCLRTAEEVDNWVTYTDEQKEQIWKRILKEGYKPREERKD